MQVSTSGTTPTIDQAIELFARVFVPIDFSPSSKPLRASALFAVKVWPSIEPVSGVAATGPVFSAGSSSLEQPATNAVIKPSADRASASFIANNLQATERKGSPPVPRSGDEHRARQVDGRLRLLFTHRI